MSFRFIGKPQAPQYAPETAPPPVCTRLERCEGCPYPRHGFICWHSDGSCMKTRMEKINEKEKNECNSKQC
jgi:hypothetical protein